MLVTTATPIKFESHSALYCRRSKTRSKLKPSQVTCWSPVFAPRAATVVEADSRGARLVLPFHARVGEIVTVCFADSLGLHQTRRARVAWTYRLENANRLMAGLAFEEEMLAA